jgi:hypothetical protein
MKKFHPWRSADYKRNGTNPSEAAIAFCAHLIWEHEGKPVGRHKIHWSHAKEQLSACNAHEHWVFPESIQ